MAEITVYNFPGLRSALIDPNYDVIRLGGDITYSSGGIIVPRTKGDIILDGQGFKITDYSSASYGDTIRYLDTAGSPMTFTVQNVTWSGKNYFGVVHTFNTANFENFTLILKNVNYTGPQPVYNRRGTTYYINSSFDLQRNDGSSVPEELGEVHHAIIQGTVTVNSQSTTTSVLWFLNASGSLVVDENAVFTVNIPGSYMFYTDGTPPPSMLFKKNSITEINTRWGLFYAASLTAHIASSFTLEEGSSFTSKQSDRRATPTFKCRDSFTMQEGSSLYITAEPSGTSSLMYFALRTVLSFNNPKSVVLYNSGGNVFEFAAGSVANPNIIDIDTELLNMWTSATPFPEAGNFEDIPARALNKADGSNINAVIQNSTAATTSININIDDGDTGYPVTISNFNIMRAKVISMGRLPVQVNSITDISAAITGETEPYANIRAIYGTVTISGLADAFGAINLPITDPIPPGTPLRVGANWKFLTKFIPVVSEGSVSITYLTDIIFKSFFVPCKSNLVKRKKPNWYLEITDTRLGGSDWYLYARISSPMSSGSVKLESDLIFDTPAYSDIISDLPTLIRQGSWTEPGAVTRLTWSEAQGFLLRANPAYPYNPGRYTGQMEWEIHMSPL